MSVHPYLLAAAAAAALSVTSPAAAADIETVGPSPATSDVAPGVDLIIELGAGGTYAPEYEGSDEYSLSPSPIIGFGYLNIPGWFEIGSTSPDNTGFDLSPSFNLTDERKSDDFDAIRGLNDVDTTYEVGVEVGYAWQYAEVWGEARYAFGGAEGFVGEFGANAIMRPTPELELKAGPFATLASEGYTETYFGVSAAESENAGFRLDAYDPDGGFKSVGVSGSARYEFRPDWFLNAEASYSTFVADAADSPIVKAGDDNQFTVGLGISKRFELDLF